MAFSTGASVLVEGYGTGIVSAVSGGPEDYTYHVVLDTRDQETGLVTRIEVYEPELSEGPERPVYSVGDRITYLNRGGVITAIEGGTLYLVMDEDPPRYGYPQRKLRFTMPFWHLHIHHL